MKVRVDKSFEKDIDKIRDPKILQKISLCVEQVIKSASVKEIPNLKGFKDQPHQNRRLSCRYSDPK